MQILCTSQQQQRAATCATTLVALRSARFGSQPSRAPIRGGEGKDKEGLPDLGGLGRLGMPILQESSELRPQQLGGASECGVQGAEGLEHKDDVGDGK